MDLPVVLAITAALFWGLGDFFAKGATKLSFLHYLLMSALPAIVFSYALWEPFSLEGLPILILISAAFAFSSYYFYEAMKIDKVGIVSSLSSTYVLLVVFLGVFIGKEPFSVLQIAGTLIAVLGITLTMIEDIPNRKFIRKETVVAIAVLFVAWGVGMYQMKYLSGIYTGEQITFYISIFFIIISIAGLIKTGEKIVAGKGSVFATLAGLGWSMGTIAYNAALRFEGIAFVSALAAFYPLVALVLGIIVNKERIKAHQIAGVVLTLAGIAAVYAFNA
jgi:drug/metabolite transporter (DMT)-like permease